MKTNIILAISKAKKLIHKNIIQARNKPNKLIHKTYTIVTTSISSYSVF